MPPPCLSGRVSGQVSGRVRGRVWLGMLKNTVLSDCPSIFQKVFRMKNQNKIHLYVIVHRIKVFDFWPDIWRLRRAALGRTTRENARRNKIHKT